MKWYGREEAIIKKSQKRGKERARFLEKQRQKPHKAYIVCSETKRVTAKRKERRKAEEKTRKDTRKEGEHLDWKPLDGDKLKLT